MDQHRHPPTATTRRSVLRKGLAVGVATTLGTGIWIDAAPAFAAAACFAT